MKNILLLCACLWALATPLRVVAGPPADIVVVRIVEGRSVTAIITRGDGKSEKVEFDRGASDENLTQSSEGYYKLFHQLYQEGYSLQSTFSTSNNLGSGFITLLFVKAP
ncbi:hypothetical protein A0257_18755 [Hymenobacter psoromatis]|nr:hypothetical protein A0257_18755 [Hymenobacter psoromatis]